MQDFRIQSSSLHRLKSVKPWTYHIQHWIYYETGSVVSGISLNGQQSQCWWRLIKTSDLQASNSCSGNLSTDFQMTLTSISKEWVWFAAHILYLQILSCQHNVESSGKGSIPIWNWLPSLPPHDDCILFPGIFDALGHPREVCHLFPVE
jgi:hypothetical protein